ncbi:MAG: uroporphyrinogen decarboxylase family protein [Dehalococcoidia bacterium]|nr:uroporphyrinogen decarboxylase family protein [Dehalococcoidia bacterium]
MKHPLERYDALATYQPPNSLIYTERGLRGDWTRIRKNVETARKGGQLTTGGGDRFFERLHFLRGYENLMADFADNGPQLQQLISMVLDNNIILVNKWLEIGVDVMGFGDDLGTQTATMMSPRHFSKHLKPGYTKMFEVCRAADTHVRLHTDGHVLEIVDDLIACGVTVLNPQVRCNTIEGIESTCKGKVCVDLDLDRQGFPFWTPKEIKAHIYEAVEVLGSPEGGLMLYAECEPDVPLENIEAICEAFEKVRQSL